jgi:hypothetical protein
MTGHNTVKCIACQTIVMQCRCFDHTKLIEWVDQCDKCKQSIKDTAGKSGTMDKVCSGKGEK